MMRTPAVVRGVRTREYVKDVIRNEFVYGVR